MSRKKIATRDILMFFPYTTRLGFIELCIFAKQNAHVCVEGSTFVNAHISCVMKTIVI